MDRILNIQNAFVQIENMNTITQNYEKTLKWLRKSGLIADTVKCCDTPMSEIYRDKKKDVYFWRCNKCLKTVNIRGSTCIPKSIY